MFVVEVAHKTVDNMDYNAEAAESRAHIAAKIVHKTVKVITNMTHNVSHNCKFVQLTFIPF